jgi:hypothetical protein
MARVRSPNYPQLSLPAAVDRVARIFAKEHRHPAPRDVVAQHLGYKGLNGASAGAISALLKYGLLEQEGESVHVTDRAISILHPSSSQEKLSALQEAARSPALFNELLEQFNGRLPSDENLRSFLIRRGYSQNALTAVIEVLRETMATADMNEASTVVQPTTAAMQLSGAPPQVRAAPIQHEMLELTRPAPTMKVSLEDDMLRVSAVLSDQVEVARLIQILTANKVLLPESSKDTEITKEITPT